MEETQAVELDVYYGVSIPVDCQVVEEEDFLPVYTNRVDALKIAKKYKGARFKSFRSLKEAKDFAISVPYKASDSLKSNGQLEGSPKSNSGIVEEKPSPYKGPKSQDLVKLRRAIESGDKHLVSILVFSNPRYLISSVDTPAILQEGARYNALHVAAKSKNAEIAEMVLETISDSAFLKLLYQDESVENLRQRANFLLDLYLNTPDKGLNETPLHFAVKFGAAKVVEVLVSYPQCDKCMKNKHGQIPHEIICNRMSNPNPHLVEEIRILLDGIYFVPVLRSKDNAIQPVIGEPFTPDNHVDDNLDFDNYKGFMENPVSPKLEVQAYAGPMPKETAVIFHKKWKTPPRLRMLREVPTAKTGSTASRLNDVEKGLEREGRNLAQEFQVKWKEFWPFLGMFCNLSEPEGLDKLEKYLKDRFEKVTKEYTPGINTDLLNAKLQSLASTEDHTKSIFKTWKASLEDEAVSQKPVNGTDPVCPLSPISELCTAFKSFTLLDSDTPEPMDEGLSFAPLNNVVDDIRNKSVESQSHTVSESARCESESLHSSAMQSPFLYVEKSCQVFATRIGNGIRTAIPMDLVQCKDISLALKEVLKPEVRCLQNLVNSYKDDFKFSSVNFQQVHSRIAIIVAGKLLESLSKEELKFVVSSLERVLLPDPETVFSSDEEDNVDHYRKLRSNSSANMNHINCIVLNLYSALTSDSDLCNEDVFSEKNKRTSKNLTEEDYSTLWENTDECTCSWEPQHFVRNSRKTASLKRNTFRAIQNGISHFSKKDLEPSLDSVTRKLAFDKVDGEWQPGVNDFDHSISKYSEYSSVHPLSAKTDADGRKLCSKALNFRQARKATQSFRKSVSSKPKEENHVEEMVTEDCSPTVIQESDVEDSGSDEFHTPPSSSGSSSPEQPVTPDEGIEVFIKGLEPTKLDLDVLHAIQGVEIDSRHYPSVYRWRHLVMLYREEDRERWPSPAVLHRRKAMNLNVSHSAPSRLFTRAAMDVLPSTPCSFATPCQRNTRTTTSTAPRRLILDSS